MALFVSLAARARAAEEITPSPENSLFNSWLAEKKATGDWNGLRDRLYEKGLAISLQYTTDVCGNPFGGESQTATYASFVKLVTEIDFEKASSINGLNLTVGNYLASGTDLAKYIGNYFSPQEIYTDGNYFFGELNLSLSLLEDTFTIEVGRLFAADVFATSDLWEYYLNAGVDSYFEAIPDNIFFPSFNITAWATRVTYQPNPNWYFITGIYNADTRVKKVNNHGTWFSFNMNNGYLAFGQMTYEHGYEAEENKLPGSTTVGSYYQSSRFVDLSDRTKRWHGNYGFYLIFDQMIHRTERVKTKKPEHFPYAPHIKSPSRLHKPLLTERPRGLTFWAGGYLAPQEHINTQTYQLMGGFVYKGLFPGRGKDVTATCFILGNYSDQLEERGQEMVAELNHRFQLGPWLYVTPDVQYIINPRGRSDIRDAMVLGFEIGVNF